MEDMIDGNILALEHYLAEQEAEERKYQAMLDEASDYIEKLRATYEELDHIISNYGYEMTAQELYEEN